MDEARELELIEEIKALNITPPEGLSKDDLEECLTMAKEGIGQKQINKAFKSRAKAGDNQAQQSQDDDDEKPAPKSYTKEELEAFAEQAAARAVREALKSIQSETPAPVAQMPAAVTERIIEREKDATKKPVKWDSRKAPGDDFMPVPFTVLHLNFKHNFDEFFIDGRRMEPPYSIFIDFDPYHGPETNRFGAAHNVVQMCVYRTHSRKEKEMFLADERWGTEFWSPEMIQVDDELELMMLMSNISRQMADMDITAVKNMATERNIGTTNLATMRAEIARFEAKKKFEVNKKVREAADANRKKQELLFESNGGVR